MRTTPQLAALCLALFSLAPRPASADCACPAKKVIDEGHRGTGVTSMSNPFPEATLPSFERSLTEGSEVLEMDVHISSDGELVVIHDDTVDRTTSGKGCVNALSLAELRALDAGKGSPMAGMGVHLSTFAEVLSAFDAPVNVEIKVEDGKPCVPSDLGKVASALASAIAADPKKRSVLVSSFDPKALDAMHAAAPQVPLALLGFSKPDLADAKQRGWMALQLQTTVVTPELVTDVHAAGLELHVWTVDVPARMRELIDMGVDRIITNEPDQLAQIRAEACSAYVCPPSTEAPSASSDSPSDSGGGCSLSSRGEAFGAGAAALALAALLGRASRGRVRRSPRP